LIQIQSEGQRHEVSADRREEPPAPLLALVRRQIRSCAVSEDGTLRIAFDGEVVLTAGPDDQCEAWELRTPKLYLVCQPGGGIAQWSGAGS
jgi:hypothetical protein